MIRITGSGDASNWLITLFSALFLGVLWLYTNVLKNSNVAINRFLDMGKKVYFITNNSTKTRDELVQKAKSMEFNVGIVSELMRK